MASYYYSEKTEALKYRSLRVTISTFLFADWIILAPVLSSASPLPFHFLFYSGKHQLLAFLPQTILIFSVSLFSNSFIVLKYNMSPLEPLLNIQFSSIKNIPVLCSHHCQPHQACFLAVELKLCIH